MFLKKMLRYFSYVSLFFTLVLIFMYLTFPINSLKEFFVQQLQSTLYGQGASYYAIPPKVEVGSMSLWRLSGIQFKQLRFRGGAYDEEDTPSVYQLDRVAVRLGFWGLLTGKKSVGFVVDGYGGELDGKLAFNKAGALSSLGAGLSDLKVDRLPFVKKAGLPAKGLLNCQVSVEMGEKPSKDSKGAIELSMKDLSVGPGELALSSVGFASGLQLPLIKLGNLTGAIPIAGGKGTAKGIQLKGGDVEGVLDIELSMSDNPLRSRVNGNGSVKVMPKFLEANPKIKTLLSLAAGGYGKEEGKLEFTLRGTLDNLRFELKNDRPSYGRYGSGRMGNKRSSFGVDEDIDISDLDLE